MKIYFRAHFKFVCSPESLGLCWITLKQFGLHSLLQRMVDLSFQKGKNKNICERMHNFLARVSNLERRSVKC